MKYFGSNIKIDGDSLAALAIKALGWDSEKRALGEAERYENEILNLLTQITQKETGKALLKAINKLGHKSMTIKPELDKFPFGKVNALAEPESLHDARKKGKAVLMPLGDSVLYVGKGTGLGSNTTIYLTPNNWVKDDFKILLGIKPIDNILADDILVHEMVHGLRQMSGVDYQKTVPFQKKTGEGKKVNCYPNIEEWFAVLIQNIYRSERGMSLRVDYGVTLEFFSDKKFIKKGMNRAHLRQLRREHGDFFSDLRKINTNFNPTRLIWDSFN